MKSCKVEGCINKYSAKGYCLLHYSRWHRLGTVELKPEPTLSEKIWVNVPKLPDNECWEWAGQRNDRNYGYVNNKGKQIYAHRFIYENVNGPIDPSLEIDHQCRNPPCVNPKHLKAVPRALNNQNLGIAKNNKSGYRGVSWHKRLMKWAARASKNHKQYHLGYFDTPEEAGKAASEWRRKNMPNSLMDKN